MTAPSKPTTRREQEQRRIAQLILAHAERYGHGSLLVAWARRVMAAQGEASDA